MSKAPAVVTALPALLFSLHALPVLGWLRQRWADQPELAPLFLLAFAAGAWNLFQLHAEGLTGLAIRRPPLIGLSLALALSLLNRGSWGIGSLDAVLTLAGAYGLLGLYLPPRAWHRAAIVFVLLALLLPVQDHLQDVAGFPFRLLTAEVVASLMRLAGVPSLSQASLVLGAGAAAAVDYPCSGLRFLHAGGAFLAAVLVVARPSRRTLLCGMGFLAALLLLNVWRVFTLVYLSAVLGLRERAEDIHTALGLAGFAACCAVLLFFMKPPRPPVATTAPRRVLAPRPSAARSRTAWTVSAVIAAFLCIEGLGATPGDAAPAALAAPALRLPGYDVVARPLSSLERSYYTQRGLTRAGKFSLASQRGGAESALLVTVSTPWYVQHAPERCVRGAGHVISRSDLFRAPAAESEAGGAQPLLVRRLVLDEGRSSLLYWYTDGGEMVADHATRLWRGLRGPRRPWALVQLAAHGVPEPDSPDVLATVRAVQHATRALLADQGASDGE